MGNGFQFHEEYTNQPNQNTDDNGDSFGIYRLLLKYNLAQNTQQAKQISIIVMLVIVIISAIIIFATNTGDSIPEEIYYDPSVELIED